MSGFLIETFVDRRKSFECLLANDEKWWAQEHLHKIYIVFKRILNVEFSAGKRRVSILGKMGGRGWKILFGFTYMRIYNYLQIAFKAYAKRLRDQKVTLELIKAVCWTNNRWFPINRWYFGTETKFKLFNRF